MEYHKYLGPNISLILKTENNMEEVEHSKA